MIPPTDDMGETSATRHDAPAKLYKMHRKSIEPTKRYDHMGIFGNKNKGNAGFGRAASLSGGNKDAALRAIREANESDDAENLKIKSDIFRMIEQGTGTIEDLWAPPHMRIYSDYIDMNGEVLAICTISNWPDSLTYGWLNSLLEDETLSDVKIDVSMHIHPVRKEYALQYMQDKKVSAEASKQAEEERGKTNKKNTSVYDQQIETAGNLYNLLEGNPNENFFQVSVVFGIYGHDTYQTEADGTRTLARSAKEDVIEKTDRFKKALQKNSQGGFAIKPLLHQQREGIKSLMPFGYGGLHAFQSMYTSALATSYPFTHGELQSDDGVFYGINPWTQQPYFLNQFDGRYATNYNTVITGSSGSGKAIESKTPVYQVICEDAHIKNVIKTPIGDIKIGNKILAGNGTVCTVTGVFPQGVRGNNYRVKLRDGREVLASDNHLWSVVKKSHGEKKASLMTTEEMYDGGVRAHGGYQYHIPVMPAIELSERNLPVDPWLVGVLIGDGCLKGNALAFSSADDFIVERVRRIVSSDGYEVYKALPNRKDYYTWTMGIPSDSSKKTKKHFVKDTPLWIALQDLGLIGKGSYEKRIPREYLLGSIAQRRELLAGLIDIDGSCSRGRWVLHTVSEMLRDDYLELVRSLGYVAAVSIDERADRYRDGKAYKIQIWTNDELASLPRKNEALRAYLAGKRQRDTFERGVPTVFGDGIADDELPLDPWMVGFFAVKGKVGDFGFGPVASLALHDDMLAAVNDHISDGTGLVACGNPKAIGHAREWQFADLDDSLGRGHRVSRSSFAEAVIGLGFGTHQAERRLPESYLHASVAVREQLLDGLIAARGHVRADGMCSFNIGAVGLADDVVSLLRSLGYSPSVSIFGNGGRKIRCRLAPRGSSRLNGYSDIAIVDIVPDDEPRDMVCITVDSCDRTFVCGDYIVTHNSATVKTLLGRYAIRGSQVFIIDPAANASGEYTNLATSLDGAVIDFGGKNGVYMNPFELSVPSSWAPGMETDQQQAQGIYRDKKEYLTGLFDIMRQHYIAENSLGAMNLQSFSKVMSQLVDFLYIFKRLSISRGKWDYNQWSQARMPTMKDFRFLMREFRKMVAQFSTRERLESWGHEHTKNGVPVSGNSPTEFVRWIYWRAITRRNDQLWGQAELDVISFALGFIEEYAADENDELYSEKAALFSGRRQADLSRQCIVFRFGNIPTNIQDIATYLAFELIYTRLNATKDEAADPDIYDSRIVVMDECWKLLESDSARNYIMKLVREGRKMKTGVWSISQRYTDFQGENRALFDQSDMKIILALSGDEVALLIDDIDLPVTLADVINSDKNGINRGVGIISISGKKKMTFPFYCKMSELEFAIADTTDSNKKALTADDIINFSKKGRR